MMKVSTVCLGFIAACGLATSMQSRAAPITSYSSGNQLLERCTDENKSIPLRGISGLRIKGSDSLASANV
jgi:hypothetical protein